MRVRMLLAVLFLASVAFGSDSIVISEDVQQAEPVWPVEFLSETRRGDDPPAPLFTLLPPDMAWVDDTMASMTLDQKIGQMIMPQWTSGSASGNVTNYHVGGFVFLANSRTTIQNATNGLQAISTHPLMFTIDCEAGSGARITDGTRFPHNMSAGASQRLDLIEMEGRITARECRAVGVHVGFGPVLDVNTDPNNPIIGIRSYGDDPAAVARNAEAYVNGANAEGLLCTFKHFPGHGPTDVDSHLALPVVSIPCDQLNAIHVQPYRTLIEKGLGDFVMSAHIWYQCLDPGSTEVPATLSAAAMTGILRDDLDFQGIVISDAFQMDGLSVVAGPAQAAVLGVQSGLDIILMPSSVSETFNGLKNAVQTNQISEERIDASVRRILAAKSRVNLHNERLTSTTLADTVFSDPLHYQVANAIGADSIVVSNSATGAFPVTPTQKIALISVPQSSSIFYTDSRDYFTNAFLAIHTNTDVLSVSATPTLTQRNEAVTLANSADRVILAMYDWKPQYSDNTTVRAAKVALVDALRGTGKPMAYVSFGSPFQSLLYPGLGNFYCSFSSHRGAQVEMARVLTGESSPQGFWPVDLVEISSVNGWMLLGE